MIAEERETVINATDADHVVRIWSATWMSVKNSAYFAARQAEAQGLPTIGVWFDRVQECQLALLRSRSRWPHFLSLEITRGTTLQVTRDERPALRVARYGVAIWTRIEARRSQTTWGGSGQGA